MRTRTGGGASKQQQTYVDWQCSIVTLVFSYSQLFPINTRCPSCQKLVKFCGISGHHFADLFCFINVLIVYSGNDPNFIKVIILRNHRVTVTVPRYMTEYRFKDLIPKFGYSDLSNLMSSSSSAVISIIFIAASCPVFAWRPFHTCP